MILSPEVSFLAKGPDERSLGLFIPFLLSVTWEHVFELVEGMEPRSTLEEDAAHTHCFASSWILH